jgi:hypothetical protein
MRIFSAIDASSGGVIGDPPVQIMDQLPADRSSRMDPRHAKAGTEGV